MDQMAELQAKLEEQERASSKFLIVTGLFGGRIGNPPKILPHTHRR
jgi:hypothetical protein